MRIGDNSGTGAKEQKGNNVNWNAFPLLLYMLAALVCILNATYSVAAQDDYIVLDGMHKFHEGDNPAWAGPDFNDSDWRKIKVPESWQAQHIAPENKVGWYRIHFSAQKELADIRPAVFLGRIGDADEVYLNGVKIGGEGVIGDRFIEAADVERLYMLPQELLTYEHDNVLAIRVLNTYVRGGIFESSVLIGDYELLLRKKVKDEFSRKGIQFVYLLLYSLVMVFIVLRYVAGVKEKEYIAFGLFVFFFCLYWMLTSLYFYESGYKTHLAQKLIYAVPTMFPLSTVIFLSLAFKEKAAWLVRIVTVLAVTLFFGYLLLLDNSALLRILDIMWMILVVVSSAIIISFCYRAYKRRIYESTPIIIGVSFCIVTAVGELLEWERIGDFGSYLFTSPAEVGVLVMVFCIAYSMDMRFARSLQSMTAFSKRIIDAHDEERKRIAFDLHDGLGQSLLALKLKIQMLSSGAVAGELDHRAPFKWLIADVSSAIEELRQISMDLRPSILEEMDIADLLAWYGKRFHEQTGIHVALSIDPAIDRLDRKVKENLYRIFQEAMGNSARHSGAKNITISLHQKAGVLTMQIADNGAGFRPELLSEKEKGLGLQTMKERTEMLGGHFIINSSPETGTRITVEVRLP